MFIVLLCLCKNCIKLLAGGHCFLLLFFFFFILNYQTISLKTKATEKLWQGKLRYQEENAYTFCKQAALSHDLSKAATYSGRRPKECSRPLCNVKKQGYSAVLLFWGILCSNLTWGDSIFYNFFPRETFCDLLLPFLSSRPLLKNLSFKERIFYLVLLSSLLLTGRQKGLCYSYLPCQILYYIFIMRNFSQYQ